LTKPKKLVATQHHVIRRECVTFHAIPDLSRLPQIDVDMALIVTGELAMIDW
jgi:hypothetical protein